MLSLVPQVQAQVDATAFGNIVNPVVTAIVDPAIELVVLVAIVVFIWGVVQMIMYANDPDARSKGKGHMLWGLVGMVIMLSAWAIVYLVSNTIKGGVDTGSSSQSSVSNNGAFSQSAIGGSVTGNNSSNPTNNTTNGVNGNGAGSGSLGGYAPGGGSFGGGGAGGSF